MEKGASVLFPGKSYGHDWENIMHYAFRELIRVGRVVSDEEFERAKNQLKLQTMLQLDGAPLLCASWILDSSLDSDLGFRAGPLFRVNCRQRANSNMS